MKLYYSAIIFFLSFGLIHAQEPQWQNIMTTAEVHPQINAQLFQLSKYAQVNQSDANLRAKQAGMLSRPDGKVFIEVQLGWDIEAFADINELSYPGFEIQAQAKNLVGGWIQLKDVIDFTNNLANENYFLTCANNFAYDHEGLDATNMASWINALPFGNYYGFGYKIAIIDSGYESLTAAQNANNAPSTYTQTDYTGSGQPFESGGPHGTGQVEMVYAYATEAEYFLYKVENTTQLSLAVASCLANEVDVIIHSASYFNTGWADNSGVICGFVGSATNDGIYWFGSAGNYNLTHAQAEFLDTDGDGKHNWSPAINENTCVVDAGTTVNIHLQWIGTPSFTNNFDISMFDENGVPLAIGNSTNSYESISWTNTTGQNQTISITVSRLNSTNKKFEFFKTGGGENALTFSQFGSSTASPANSTEPLCMISSVTHWLGYGVAQPGLWNTCSYGPTNGGHQNIDFCMPTGMTLTSYPSGIFGSSSGAPNLAGLFVVLLDSSPLNGEGSIEVLKALALINKDWGDAGADDKYGFGGVGVPNPMYDFEIEETANWHYFPPNYYIIEGYTNSANTSELPFGSLQQANDHIPSTGLSRMYFIGGTYDPPPIGQGVFDKKVVIKSFTEDAKIAQ